MYKMSAPYPLPDNYGISTDPNIPPLVKVTGKGYGGMTEAVRNGITIKKDISSSTLVTAFAPGGGQFNGIPIGEESRITATNLALYTQGNPEVTIFGPNLYIQCPLGWLAVSSPNPCIPNLMSTWFPGNFTSLPGTNNTSGPNRQLYYYTEDNNGAAALVAYERHFVFDNYYVRFTPLDSYFSLSSGCLRETAAPDAYRTNYLQLSDWYEGVNNVLTINLADITAAATVVPPFGSYNAVTYNSFLEGFDAVFQPNNFGQPRLSISMAAVDAPVVGAVTGAGIVFMEFDENLNLLTTTGVGNLAIAGMPISGTWEGTDTQNLVPLTGTSIVRNGNTIMIAYTDVINLTPFGVGFPGIQSRDVRVAVSTNAGATFVPVNSQLLVPGNVLTAPLANANPVASAFNTNFRVLYFEMDSGLNTAFVPSLVGDQSTSRLRILSSQLSGGAGTWLGPFDVVPAGGGAMSRAYDITEGVESDGITPAIYVLYVTGQKCYSLQLAKANSAIAPVGSSWTHKTVVKDFVLFPIRGDNKGTDTNTVPEFVSSSDTGTRQLGLIVSIKHIRNGANSKLIVSYNDCFSVNYLTSTDDGDTWQTERVAPLGVDILEASFYSAQRVTSTKNTALVDEKPLIAYPKLSGQDPLSVLVPKTKFFTTNRNIDQTGFRYQFGLQIAQASREQQCFWNIPTNISSLLAPWPTSISAYSPNQRKALVDNIRVLPPK